MNDDSPYHEIGSFTLGEHWQFAADSDRIAFAQTDGEVILFDANGRETVTLPNSLSALEVERYLVPLSDDEVSAYTSSGVELWTQTVPGATDLVAFGEKDVLAVLTSEGDVVGLDLETGGRLFETRRPHDDFTDTHVAGGNGLLCIGAWSFVVCIDTAGTVVVDRNLDSTVEGVSVLDGLVLATLKDGTVVTLDPSTGGPQWRNSANLRHLAPRGQQQVPALTESGAAVIHAEGRIEQLAVEPGQRIVSSADGSVLGVADETSIRVYRRGPPPSAQLEADVLTTELDAETPVRVYVENTGSTPVETTISLDSPQQLRVDSRHVSLDLDAGQSREAAFRFQNLPTADHLEYQLFAGDTELDRGSMPVTRQVDLSEAVTVDVTPQQVTADTVVVRSTVENRGDTTLDTVRLDGETVTGLEPGETTALEHTVPLDGSDRTVQVEVATGHASETIEQQVSVPASAVQVGLARGDEDTPWLDIDVEPTVQARVRGELTVDLPDDVTVSRGITLGETERLRLVVFLPPSVSTRDEIPVAVDSLLLEEETRTRIAGWDESTVQRVRSESATTTDARTPRAGQHSHDQDTSSPERAGLRTADRRNPSTDNPAIQVDRELPEQTQRGTVFTDRLRITNASREPLEEVLISDTFDQYRITQLGARDELTVQRYHAVFETGTHELSPVQLGDERTSSHEVQVVEPDVECRAQAVYDRETEQGHISVTVSNDSGSQCRIPRAGIDISATESGQMWEFDEPFVVDPGETETRRQRIDVPAGAQLERTTRLVVVEYLQAGEQHRYRTLAPLSEATASADAPVSVTLLDKSRLVADTQGIVDIEVENESQEPIENGTITVEGEIVMETALSQDSKTIPRLAPDERETLLVDVMPEATDVATFDVVVDGTVEGEPVTQRLTFTGPVAGSGDAWDREAYLDEWTAATEDEGATRVELEETHLLTPFQPTEEGSLR